MKVALFHNVPVGGAKRVVYEHARYLSREHTVEVFSVNPEKGNLWNLKEVVTKIHKYYFPIKQQSGLVERIKSDYRSVVALSRHHKKIADYINKNNFDIAITYPDRVSQAPYLLKYLEIPSTYYCMELLRMVYEEELKFSESVSLPKKYYEYFIRKLRKDIDKNNATSATKIIAISKFTKRDIQTAYKRSSIVIYPGVDVEIFKPSEQKGTPYQYLYVGSKSAIEGYDTANDTSELLEKILKLSNKKMKTVFKVISFTKESPKLSDSELAKEYSKSLVTICSSLNETFGLGALESMACGTTVLALDEAAYLETMKDGATGYLLPRDPQAFANKIKFLIDNPNVAKKMGKAGREHVIKNFTWEKHNKKLEKLLLKLANGS